jgi:TPR repeat protein
LALAAAVVAAVVWTEGSEIAKLPPVSGMLAAVGLSSDTDEDGAYPPAPEEMEDQVLIPRLDGARLQAPAGENAAVGDAKVEFLVERGNALLRGADAVSARHFFARAAETGNAAAAAAMAASYDPLYLERNAIRGVNADPEQAAAWYRVAIARGDQAAVERLNRLLAAPAPVAEPAEATSPPAAEATAQPSPASPPTQP